MIDGFYPRCGSSGSQHETVHVDGLFVFVFQAIRLSGMPYGCCFEWLGFFWTISRQEKFVVLLAMTSQGYAPWFHIGSVYDVIRQKYPEILEAEAWLIDLEDMLTGPSILPSKSPPPPPSGREK